MLISIDAIIYNYMAGGVHNRSANFEKGLIIYHYIEEFLDGSLGDGQSYLDNFFDEFHPFFGEKSEYLSQK